jgi:hypothetical protein
MIDRSFTQRGEAMAFDLWPTTQEILDVLSGEVARSGGIVSHSFDDGVRLYARAVLPATHEVAPGDRLQGGVALRADDEEIRVHPYVFRQVCSNGAIFAQVVGTRQIRRDECDFVVLPQVCDAVRACCCDEAFAVAADQMRSAKNAEANAVLNLIPSLSTFLRGQAGLIVREVLARFRRERDRSRFGLMNAVTATARDTRDPELRWRLEELGGAIPAHLPRPITPRGGAAAARAPRESELALTV